MNSFLLMKLGQLLRQICLGRYSGVASGGDDGGMLCGDLEERSFLLFVVSSIYS